VIKEKLLAPPGQFLNTDEVVQTLQRAFEGEFHGKKVLVLIPDHTRSLPLPFLFRALTDALRDTSRLDFMVALGTHPALADEDLCRLVGITREERDGIYRQVGLLNHNWSDPSTLVNVGTIDEDEMKELSGRFWHSSLPARVDIQINRAIYDYDQILILGPTFPHEVVGFSGGAKYLFPGISGPEMINATHWLGALAGVVGTIGIKDTPVRRMIHAAAERVHVPIILLALIVEGHDLSGMVIGDYLSAWNEAAEISSERHIHWCDKPYRLVLSRAPEMYDELWTAAKAMYKLEPAVAMGGEVIIYAPHLKVVSHVHGRYIHEAGYHTLAYFLEHWDQYKHIPLGVLAHCTHVRGSGRMDNGVERSNVKVTLASGITAEECAQINLNYLDPASIKIGDYQGREAEGILYVPRAGEILYRIKN
jgi:nickel-dependent lactate racemase